MWEIWYGKLCLLTTTFFVMVARHSYARVVCRVGGTSVPRSTMNKGVVDQESWRLTEGRQPGRPVQVHRCTGTPWRRAWRCTKPKGHWF